MATETVNVNELARQIRINALVAIYHAGSGHPGGSLSCADILAYLWARELRYNPEDYADPTRDRFIMSKGHCCPALYGVAAELGLLERSQLRTLRKLGSPLQGHTHVGDLPWVEASTGSLGQGFSVAIGVAMGLRHVGQEARVFAMLGDGEMQEGEVWEGAMCAGHHKLDKLCAILDYNKMQSDDLNDNIMTIEPLADKWRAFNWHVIACDGHDTASIESAFTEARNVKEQPAIIIADTKKGRGVSYMEGQPLWHGSCKLSDEDISTALTDLGVPADEIAAYKANVEGQ